MWRVVSMKGRQELMDEAFEIYATRFAPDEIEPNSVLQEYLCTDWWHAFAALDDDNTVVGGIHINHLADVRGVCVEHIYTKERLQRRGIGTALWNHVEGTVFPELGAELAVLEMEDPFKMTAEEIAKVEAACKVDFAGREDFWKSRLFKKVDGPYLQGILPGASDGCYNLALLAKWLKPHADEIESDFYLEVLRVFMATYLEGAPSEDPFYLRIERAIRRRNLAKLDFIPVSAERAHSEC